MERQLSQNQNLTTQPTGPGNDVAPTNVVGYIMSRFPKISETFILYEILELERQGVSIEVFPLVREEGTVVHAEAAEVVERAHFNHLASWATISAQVYWLRRSPRAYLSAWTTTIRGNRASPKFLLRSLYVMPQAAVFARRAIALGVSHVHAHWATHPTLAALQIHRLTGLPYSFTAHAHDIYVEQAMLDEKIRGARFVVTISEYNRRLLASRDPQQADKIVVVHCGIDPDVFRPEPRSANELFTLVCTASLEEKKGHPYLIEACAMLRERGVPFRCLLIGDGPDRADIQRMIDRFGLAEQVTLLGARPRADVVRALASADTFVLPSVTTSNGRQEGIPVALMEAMAMGKPVVATRISGIPELVDHDLNGLLVPERDAVALADALERLATDPALCQRLAHAGRAKVASEFNLRRSAESLRGLFSNGRYLGRANETTISSSQGVEP